MAIITSSEVKSYLNISSTTYDTLIALMIEPCLYDVFDYCNNYFENNSVRVRTGNFTFSSTAGTVVVTGTNFSTLSFQSGDEIRIKDSIRNDGIYTATTVSSATITLSSSSPYGITFKTETEEAELTIVKMDVPVSLKPIISQMIKYRIDHPLGNPQSESLGDYSVVYGGYDYPQSITSALNKYRMVRFV